MVQPVFYNWDLAENGDKSPPHVELASPEFIAEFCRVARYENPVYTSQAAAGESGLPGGIAPPAMVLALAPVRLAEVAAARGCVLPIPTDPADPEYLAISPIKLSINYQGVIVAPEDVVTSTTATHSKSHDETGFYLSFWVSAHNQRGEAVVEYWQTFTWLNPSVPNPEIGMATLP